MRNIIEFKITNKKEAETLFIKAIKEFQAANKREYIEKNIKEKNKYPSVTYFRENFSLNFDECRELAGVKHVHSKKKWDNERLYSLIYENIKTHGFKVVSYNFLKEEIGIDMKSTFVRKGGITKFKEKVRKEHPELIITSYD